MMPTFLDFLQAKSLITEPTFTLSKHHFQLIIKLNYLIQGFPTFFAVCTLFFGLSFSCTPLIFRRINLSFFRYETFVVASSSLIF